MDLVMTETNVSDHVATGVQINSNMMIAMTIAETRVAKETSTSSAIDHCVERTCVEHGIHLNKLETVFDHKDEIDSRRLHHSNEEGRTDISSDRGSAG